MAETVKDWDAFELAAPPLAGAEPLRGLKRGRPVSAGQLLARRPDPRLGDLQAPVSGFIEAINEAEIIIRRDPAAVGEPPEPLRPAELEPPEFKKALKALGLNQPEFTDCLIISALDPEPGLTCSRPLLAEHQETLAAGLSALKRLSPAARLFWAGARPEEAPPGADEIFRLRPEYPWTLPALVKKRLADRLAGRRRAARPTENIKNAGTLDLRALFLLGRAWRTGRPLSQIPLTLGSANYFIPLGARPIDLLTSAHLKPGPGDAAVVGGLVRGRALAGLERGLGADAAGLHLIRRAAGPPPEPCRHCGDCVRACPEGRPMEFFRRLETENGSREDCLACGACALACPARRPLLAWARLHAPPLPSPRPERTFRLF